MRVERKSRDVLSVVINPNQTLDVVRVPEDRGYKIVYASRGHAIERRTAVTLPRDVAVEVGRFLSGDQDEVDAAFDKTTTD